MNKSDIDRLGIGPVKKFGRYTLIKKLATGGMAEIWLARQTGLAGFNRFVVIKKILSHLGEEETFVKMFLDEARMSVQLTHPNIVQVYDLGEAERTYFIAMEYIAGENLAAIAWRGVKRRKPLSAQFAARIIADASRALNYAHHLKGPDGVAHELVHRDISPQNILVTYEGEVKVVDFGIAKAATKSQHTKTGMLKGKFSYMSPEQCLGNPLDMRSDIFALGIVLYELCTGKRLFKHESELMILEMITKRRITPPSQVAEGVSPELERIILKALEKEVTDRYQTAQDLAIALENYLREEAEQSGSSDIASYMRSLFKDKIEEKQEVCQLAEAEDFLASFADEEPTEQGLPRGPTAKGRRVIYGNAPSTSSMGVSMPGLPHPSQGTPAGMMPYPQRSGFHPGMPVTHSGQTGMPFSGLPYPTGSMGVPPLAPDRGLAPKIVLGVALVVIGLASAFLFKLLQAPSEFDQPLASQQAAPVNTKTGKISISSTPSGAEVVVNDDPVKLEGGEVARTPIASLTELQFGKKYKIQLRLEGHREFTQEIVMSESSDGLKVDAHLEPFKGEVRIKVAGSIADQVEVHIQNKKVGTGNSTLQHPQGEFRVEGRLSGYRCKSEPEVIKVKQHAIAVAEIHCDEIKRPMLAAASSAGTRSSGSRSSRGGSSAKPVPEEGGAAPIVRTGPAGCQRLEGHFGNVTISSEPYSVIYLDDKLLGETPLAKVRIPAGCMFIRAVHPETKKEKTMRINVEPNRTSRYKITL